MTLTVKYMGEYDYVPSVPVASIFAALFALTSFYHTYQLIRTRTWYFTAFVIGGYFEVIGYIFRGVSGNQYPNYTITPIAIQTILILIAPSLFAASIYMTLGRIILITKGEKYAVIRRTWLTKIFVIGDVLSFLTQAGGASILVQQTANSFKSGEAIIKAGLILQIVFFGLFILTSVLFHFRLVKYGYAELARIDVDWKRHIYALYTGSVFIFIRCIFRLIEYDQGSGGALLQHEYYIYIFDAAMMLIVMAVFNWVYPSAITEQLRLFKNPSTAELNMSTSELPLHEST